jgi:hypothetical protein
VTTLPSHTRVELATQDTISSAEKKVWTNTGVLCVVCLHDCTYIAFHLLVLSKYTHVAYLKKKDNDTGHKIHRSSVQRSDYSCNGQIPYLRSGHKSLLGGRKGDMTSRRPDCLVSCRVTWTDCLISCRVTWTGCLVSCRVTWTDCLISCRVTWTDCLVSCRVTWTDCLVSCRVTWTTSPFK